MQYWMDFNSVFKYKCNTECLLESAYDQYMRYCRTEK